MTATDTWTFEVPTDQIAGRPPEHRGLARDEVRMLVARPDGLAEARFHDLGRFLSPDDVVVVNTSATRPAAVDGQVEGRAVTVHFSVRERADRWVVELRPPDQSGPVLDGRSGWQVGLPDGLVTLRQPVAVGPDGRGVRLWSADVTVTGGRVTRWLYERGHPIAYTPETQLPLEAYQTVFARHDGSAEMPSAGRPFSLSLVTDLVSRGIALAPVQLHAGVSSQTAGEPPGRERYVVPERTAALVNQARRTGGRVIAVGTTVTRALETVADARGTVRAGRGWTDLVITADRGVRTVDGLLTGWHEADASHLDLLAAVAGPDLVRVAYRHALDTGYLWHEFGDSALLLP